MPPLDSKIEISLDEAADFLGKNLKYSSEYFMLSQQDIFIMLSYVS